MNSEVYKIMTVKNSDVKDLFFNGVLIAKFKQEKNVLYLAINEKHFTPPIDSKLEDSIALLIAEMEQTFFNVVGFLNVPF